MKTDLNKFICNMPKAELHMHVEGSFEPELMFQIAERNQIELPYDSVDALRAAYQFKELQEFLDIYYQGMSVLLHEQDFYDLATAYFEKSHEQSVVHTELFFDPQGHTSRGVAFSTVMNGLMRAQHEAYENHGLTSRLILCFLRHLDESDAESTLDQALDFRHAIEGVGLDSSEIGHPPEKFQRVFDRAAKSGFKRVAHAGEEGPPDYVRQAINLLHVDRIDHGNRAVEDEALLEQIVQRELPLTLCPLSNLRLCVINNMSNHPVGHLLSKGVIATINSDDPAYFGGYVNENFLALAKATDLTQEQFVQLARNSFTASFLDNHDKQQRLSQIDDYCKQH